MRRRRSVDVWTPSGCRRERVHKLHQVGSLGGTMGATALGRLRYRSFSQLGSTSMLLTTCSQHNCQIVMGDPTEQELLLSRWRRSRRLQLEINAGAAPVSPGPPQARAQAQAQAPPGWKLASYPSSQDPPEPAHVFPKMPHYIGLQGRPLSIPCAHIFSQLTPDPAPDARGRRGGSGAPLLSMPSMYMGLETSDATARVYKTPCRPR